MATLTFSQATLAGKTVYAAEIEDVKGTINKGAWCYKI